MARLALGLTLAISLAARAQAVPDPVADKPAPQAPATPPQPLTPPSLAGPAIVPEYPAAATGTARVLVELTIDETGSVKDPAVASLPQPLFDEAALAHVAKLKFNPAHQGEQAIPVRIQYAINFVPPVTEAPKALAPSEQPVNLKGQVRERGTRRKLSGIELTVTGSDVSAVTDKEGHFELHGVPEGKQHIVIAAPGYLRFEVEETIEPGKLLEVRYLIQAEFSSPFEATVSADKERKELSKTTISIEEVNRIPGTQGDALKVIENLPGVARTSPIGGGLLVIRGSKPGDSLAYLDGLPIPLLYHFGAFSSTVTPDLLSGIEYIPGNFSVAYGDLTGGIVEVTSRPLREELHGFANVNGIEASLLLEGAIPEVPGLRASISGRRSYIDVVLKFVLDTADANVSLTAAPVYYDAQLRLDYTPPNSNQKLQFIALTSDDAFKLLFKRPVANDPNVSGDLNFDTAFSQLRLKHEWRSGAFSLGTVAMYEHLNLLFDLGTSTFRLLGNDLFLRSIGSWEVSDQLSFSAGLELINRHVNVAADLPASALFREGDPAQAGPRADDNNIHLAATPFNRASPGAFFEARWRPLPNLVITPGVRLDTYVYTDQDTPKTTLLPRLTARWDVNERFALKGGVGLYSEGTRNGDGARLFGNPDLFPERALQFTAGVEVRPFSGLFASTELFYKSLSDLAVRPTADVSTTNLVNLGTGRVFGLEVLIRKELTDRLFGWIAYTLSRSDRVDRPGSVQRLFDFDQTHNLTIVASYKLPRGWQAGLRFRLISGNPDTPVLGGTYLAGSDTYLPVYGETNSTRLPLFHQLDFRVDKVWTWDSWQLDAYLDLLNAYNHRSIEGSQFSFDFSQHSFIQGLPIFPSVGWKASF
ncbi:MAG: TonB-dependent receptor [Deltaproteobacteria bacterium]|nr:TonB-dependent receptor [Deltaproteobacteria bacterium]